jgi:hypothetical protein
MTQPNCRDCNKHYIDCDCIKKGNGSESASTGLLSEELFADERENMARKLLRGLQDIERPDIAIAMIIKSLDDAYKQNR